MASRKHKERLKARRVEIFVDEDIKEAINALSDEFGVSRSQLYQYFAMMGLNNVKDATKLLSRYLEPSEAPMWQHRINFERLRKDLGIE